MKQVFVSYFFIVSVLRRGLSQQTLKTLLLHQGRKRREQTTRENSEREWRRTQSSTINTGLLKISGTKDTGRRGVTKLFCTTGSCRKYGSRSIGKGWRRRISLSNTPRYHRHGEKTVNCQAEKTGKGNNCKEKTRAITRSQLSTRSEETPMLQNSPRRQPQSKDNVPQQHFPSRTQRRLHGHLPVLAVRHCEQHQAGSGKSSWVACLVLHQHGLMLLLLAFKP